MDAEEIYERLRVFVESELKLVIAGETDGALANVAQSLQPPLKWEADWSGVGSDEGVRGVATCYAQTESEARQKFERIFNDVRISNVRRAD